MHTDWRTLGAQVTSTQCFCGCSINQRYIPRLIFNFSQPAVLIFLRHQLLYERPSMHLAPYLSGGTANQLHIQFRQHCQIQRAAWVQHFFTKIIQNAAFLVMKALLWKPSYESPLMSTWWKTLVVATVVAFRLSTHSLCIAVELAQLS